MFIGISATVDTQIVGRFQPNLTDLAWLRMSGCKRGNKYKIDSKKVLIIRENMNSMPSPREAKRREPMFKRHINWTEQHPSRNKETELLFLYDQTGLQNDTTNSHHL
jgi:hypothetical protein